MSEHVPSPPFESVLRFLDHELTADEVSALSDRLRNDDKARRQAAGLLLQIGTFGELAVKGDDERLVRRPRPPARARPWQRTAVMVAGACLAAAAVMLLIGKPRLPVRSAMRAGERNVHARAVGTPGATPAIVAPVARAGRVLLVHGGDPGRPGAGDLEMIRHLEGLGFEVAHASDAGLSADDLSSVDLVVISASSRSQEVRDQIPRLRLRDAPVPIVTCETSSFDLLGMTGPRVSPGQGLRNGFGSAPSHDSVAIETPGHVLAAGLDGTHRVASAPVALSWGAPSEGAIRVASLGGRGRELVVQFAYEKGAPMVGLAAPARRVACFVSADAAEVLTPEGWRLFDAGVRWATGR